MRSRLKVISVLCVFVLGTSAAFARQYLYVNNYASGTIGAYAVDASTGKLSAVPGSPFTSAAGPNALHATADGRALFAVHFTQSAPRTSAKVSSWRINQTTGALAPVGGSPLSFELQVDGFGISAAFAPSGRLAYVLVAQFTGGSKLFGIRADATTGDLQLVPGAPLTFTDFTQSPAFGPDGKVLYLPYIQSISASSVGRINVYSVGTDGALTLGNTVSTGGYGPMRPVLGPSGTYLLTAQRTAGNVGAPATLAAFSVNPSSGALTGPPASVIAAGTDGALRYQGLSVHPSGKFAYLTTADPSTPLPLISRVAAFRIDTNTGTAAAIAGSPLDTEGTGAGVGVVDPTGKFFYVPNTGSNTIQAYTIDQTSGALTRVNGSPFTAGGAARGLACDPAGKFLFSAEVGANTISTYAIHPTTGALTFAHVAPTGDQPMSLALVEIN